MLRWFKRKKDMSSEPMGNPTPPRTEEVSTMSPLDRKFTFTATHVVKGTTITEGEAILFKASDPSLTSVLKYYRDDCLRRGAAEAQIEGINLLMQRVMAWQAANPELVKVADVDEGEEYDIVCAPNVPIEGEEVQADESTTADGEAEGDGPGAGGEGSDDGAGQS